MQQGVLLGPAWRKWGDWLGAGALFAVLLAMGLSPYMGGGVVPWLIIYGPMLLFLYWLLRRFVQIRPGVFTLSLAVLLAVRLAMNGIAYEMVCRRNQPVLLKPLEVPASFRQVYFYDGAPDGGRVASVCDVHCLALLTLRNVSFMEFSPETADRRPNVEKQRVQYDWQNPVCADWVRDHPVMDDRLLRIGRGLGLVQIKFNYPKNEYEIARSQWEEVKSCFIYSKIDRFESVYSYDTLFSLETNVDLSKKYRDNLADSYRGNRSRVFFTDFIGPVSVLFESERGVQDGLVGLVGLSTMYSYRSFAISVIDPFVGVGGGWEPVSEVCNSYNIVESGRGIFDLIVNAITARPIND